MSDAPLRFVEPAVVTSQFHLRDGDVVADFGAGRGFFMAPLAAAVGASGVVYMLEIQKNLVAALGEQARELGLEQVRPLWADIEEPHGANLPDAELDAATVVNVLFQFADPVVALTEMVRTLRPGGKLFIIDWSESFGQLGPTPEMVITEATARAHAETAGLVFERTLPAGDHHYGIAFRKP